jgi:hypothetical protein
MSGHSSLFVSLWQLTLITMLGVSCMGMQSLQFLIVCCPNLLLLPPADRHKMLIWKYSRRSWLPTAISWRAVCYSDTRPCTETRPSGRSCSRSYGSTQGVGSTVLTSSARSPVCISPTVSSILNDVFHGYHQSREAKGATTVFFHKSSVALVRERTIPTERPPFIGEVSANFFG